MDGAQHAVLARDADRPFSLAILVPSSCEGMDRVSSGTKPLQPGSHVWLLLWCWVYLGQWALRCRVQPAESVFMQMSEATDQSCFSKANDVKIQRIKIQVVQMIKRNH